MGAILGAAVAMEWDDAEIRDRLRGVFVESSVINDYTLPFPSLVKGNKATRRLEEHFGSILIRDLWRPSVCVWTNLPAGAVAVDRDGPITPPRRAVRAFLDFVIASVAPTSMKETDNSSRKIEQRRRWVVQPHEVGSVSFTDVRIFRSHDRIKLVLTNARGVHGVRISNAASVGLVFGSDDDQAERRRRLARPCRRTRRALARQQGSKFIK
jgi:hypothetical protein